MSAELRALPLLLLLSCLIAAADDTGSELTGRSVKAIIDEYREQGYPFVYIIQLVDGSLRVSNEPSSGDPVEIVREILGPHGLGIRTASNVHLVIRLERDERRTGRLLLILNGARENQPVHQPSIDSSPSLQSRHALKPGFFEFDDVRPGRYRLRVTTADFQAVERTIDVWPGQTEVVELSMAAAKPEIDSIEVSASRYEISRDIGGSLFSLDQRDIETMPDIGDDPLRSVQRLPGAAASGASAKTHLRGGDRDEIGIMLNGQKLFDPFHVRDYQSVFSVIDSRAIEGVEVYTGGFPVRFGNRMRGMVLMDALEPVDRRHVELGLSVYNTLLLFASREDNKQWLFSARRGNLDLIINEKLDSPSHYDVFAEFAWEPNPDMTVSFNALFADDRVEIVLKSDPEELERIVSDTRNS